MQNVSKPTSSYSNDVKVSIGETWTSITTTWATETRTWQEVSQLFSNLTKAFDTIWMLPSPWTMLTPWQSDGDMTNVSRP